MQVYNLHNSHRGPWDDYITFIFPSFPRSWIFPCGNGAHQCSTQDQYYAFLFGPQPGCPSVQNSTATPPPATTCGLHNNTCSFVAGDPICFSWLHNCGFQYSCTTQEEFTAATREEVVCSFPAAPPPSPDSICIPVNGTCQRRQPCRVWQNWCGGDYVCGSEAQYAAFIHGPQPICAVPPPNATEPVPAGECVYQNGLCEWSGISTNVVHVHVYMYTCALCQHGQEV